MIFLYNYKLFHKLWSIFDKRKLKINVELNQSNFA